MATNNDYFDPYKIIKNVHRRIVLKYQVKMGKDSKDAQTLQTFLQQIKSFNLKSKSGDEYQRGIAGVVLKEIAKGHGNSQKFLERLLNRSGGFNLENDLADIMLGVTKAVQADIPEILEQDSRKGIQNRKIFQTGKQSSNNFMVEIVDEKLKEILPRVIEKTSKSIGTKNLNLQNKQNQSIIEFSSVERKSDNTGLNASVQINANVNEDLVNIYRILNRAKISAKNYKGIGSKGEDLKEFGIKLGTTNPFRAFYSVLSDLNYNNYAIQKTFVGLFLDYEKNPSGEAELHFDHIRFVYELTGQGMGLSQGGKEGINFLIYNDPTGNNIYVKSAAQMIVEFLETKSNNIFQKSKKLFGTIHVAREYF